jgi:hypothetical protein
MSDADIVPPDTVPPDSAPPDTAPSLPKLPLREAISLSYAWFFQKFPDLLRISWLWLLICAALVGISSWMQWTWMADVLGADTGGMLQRATLESSRPIELLILGYIAGLLPLIAGVSIAVAWHRRIILGEQPGLSGSNILAGELWRYIGVGILIMLVTTLPLVFILVLAVVLASQSIAALVGLLLCLAAIAVVLRLSLILPARAIGDVGLTIREAWHRTRGNTWRLFWGTVACTLPPAILLETVSLIVFGTIGSQVAPGQPLDTSVALAVALMSTIFFVVYLLIVPIGIGFLSHAYRHFFQGGLEAAA